MPVRVFLAPTLEAATSQKQIAPPEVTIEAEYGAVVVEGTEYTAAHHQPEGRFAGRHLVADGRPAPCNDPDIPVLTDGTILISHVDEDTIGGCLRALGWDDLFAAHTEGFWNLVEFMDIYGAHRLSEAHADHEDLEALYAFFAWTSGHRLGPAKGTVDVTEYIEEAGEALRRILVEMDQIARNAGRTWKQEQDRIAADTFVETVGAVIIRVGPGFCNHLYNTPDGAAYQGVAHLNTRSGGITISLAMPVKGVSCRKIVQKIWGSEAGGHDGIAGSPRGMRMGLFDLQVATTGLQNAIHKAMHPANSFDEVFDRR